MIYNVHFILQVQLNIQPVNKDGHLKINIIDVLKIDPEENFPDKNGVDSADDNSSGNMVKTSFGISMSLVSLTLRLA